MSRRSDGRSGKEVIREHHFGLDVLKKADGSARLVAGSAEVLVAVTGPGQVKARQEQTDRATLSVSVQTLSTPPSINETALATRLKEALDKMILSQLHPRTLISIVVQPISLQKPSFAAIFNASVAALIDAAIPMRSTFIAVNGCKTKEGISLDPTSEEMDGASATFTFVFNVQKEDESVVMEEIAGNMSVEELADSRIKAKEAAQKIFKSLRTTVRERIERISTSN